MGYVEGDGVMLLNIFSIIFLYTIAMAFIYAVFEEFIENPLWLGLIVMFWPIALVLIIPSLVISIFVEWIKDCVEYYKEKRDETS